MRVIRLVGDSQNTRELVHSTALGLVHSHKGEQTAVRYEATHFQRSSGLISDWQLSLLTRVGNLLTIKQRGNHSTTSDREPLRFLLPVLPEEGQTHQRVLNSFRRKLFHMLTLNMLSRSVCRGHLFTSVDLQDSYFHIL